jgi:hypothetical protein
VAIKADIRRRMRPQPLQGVVRISEEKNNYIATMKEAIKMLA